MQRRGNRIDEEGVCIDSLVQYLLRAGESLVDHQREPNDPPDAWLSLGYRRFAVEVTSIVADQGYAALCRSLHSSIKKHCAGFIGTYAIEIFRRPTVPKKASKRWKSLVSEMITSIKAMSASPALGEIVVIRGKEGKLSLSKLDVAGSSVGLIYVPEPKWEVEVQEDLSMLLSAAIEKKRRRFLKKSIGDSCDGIILALYDAYGFGGADAAREALARLQGYEWLHSIYWATSFTDCRNILYPGIPGRSGEFL